jgi:hypothetical protein
MSSVDQFVDYKQCSAFMRDFAKCSVVVPLDQSIITFCAAERHSLQLCLGQRACPQMYLLVRTCVDRARLAGKDSLPENSIEARQNYYSKYVSNCGEELEAMRQCGETQLNLFKEEEGDGATAVATLAEFPKKTAEACGGTLQLRQKCFKRY